MGGRCEGRWQAALESCPPAWPEVLRRLTLRKAADARGSSAGSSRPAATAGTSATAGAGAADELLGGCCFREMFWLVYKRHHQA